MRARLIVILAILSNAEGALAGAWTVERGHVEMFSGVTASRATQQFDGNGRSTGDIVFNKLLAQNWMEYGLTGAITLFAAPQYIMAEVDLNHTGTKRVRSTSVETGCRLLLSSRIGKLSLQVSGKSAGAFDMSTSAGGEDGRQFELRLLYGRSFKLFGRDAFFDIQAAERWTKQPRPDELVIDATAGLWLTKDYLVLLQNFNLISDGEVILPYVNYRLHKMQASLVGRITSRWSLQGGYFFAPAGQNIVQEQGVVATIWYRT